MKSQYTVDVRKCDRCTTETKCNLNNGGAFFAEWSMVSAQGGHPTQILPHGAGDGYKIDLCPTCTKEFLIWFGKAGNE